MYLPESFEWMILAAGVLKNNQIDKMLDSPAGFVERKDYFSWERFFTAVLTEETKATYLAYVKKKLNPAYLNDTIKQQILEQMEKVELDWKRKN